jgi:photosystem II stability/assembly factor-like uncharacterized protein
MNVLVGTADGLVVDGRQELSGHHVTALAGDWAILDRSSLVQRISGGSWHTWVAFEPHESIKLTSLTPVGRDVFLGDRGGHLLRHRVEGESPHLVPVEGFDAVSGRDEWHAVGSREPYVRSLTATADGVILANVHVGGIPRSTDGGETWEPTIDVDDDVHQVRAHPERPELVLAAAAVGVCRSDDAGATWQVRTDGLHATYCRAVALAGDLMLVSASTGPFTDQGALYRRALDTDGPFERCTDGLPEWQPDNVDTGCLDTDGERAAFGGADGVVYGSEDAGRTWRVLADGLPPVTAVAIA